MSALLKIEQFSGEIIYIHDWISSTTGKVSWRRFHAARILRHQGRELHEEHEANRLGYCVTCHRSHMGDDDDGA